MSKRLLVLGTSVLAATGSLTFILRSKDDQPKPAESLVRQEQRGKASATGSSRSPHHSFRGNESYRPTRSQPNEVTAREAQDIQIADSRTSHLSPAQRAQVEAVVGRIENDSRQTLAELSEEYALTRDQRRAIYPLVAAHHESAHPSLRIGGHTLPTIAHNTSLEESISSYLNADQHGQLVENEMARHRWWEDVLGQIEDDLNASLDISDEAQSAGEPNSPSQPGTAEPSPPNTQGTNSSHSGGNLFDLLGN
jgi:hypothetical protein